MSSKKQRSRKSPGLRALPIGDVLRALPPRELSKLIERVGVVVDEQKRIDVPSQVARALINLPEARDPSRLPGPTA
ncbi:MAG TPA: hypothetical protein PKD61_36385, partial [Polyangiaceae bacterium]|nr:hypothetical protein [Polyangiaceae bacterium]